MLTGDKLETAQNIGRSCNLLPEDMLVLYIRSSDVNIQDKLTELELAAKLSISESGVGLIVEGEALGKIKIIIFKNKSS